MNTELKPFPGITAKTTEWNNTLIPSDAMYATQEVVPLAEK